MWKRVLLIGIAGGAALILNGCMMWMHGDMAGHDEHPAGAGTTLIKEVRQNDVKMTAEIPPLWAGREAALSLKVEDLSSGRPLSGAEVDVLAQRKDEAGMLKSVQGSAREGAASGVYVFRQTFVEPGWYEFFFTVKKMPGPGMSLTAQKEVLQAPGLDEAGHSGGRSTTLYMIGGAMMVVMMLVFML